MTPAAWGFLTAVWGLILVMTGYCFYKLLTSERDLSSPE
jgi:hypothetical protein